MKCLDTDFLVAILRGKNDAKSKMESLDAEGRNATTTINAFELFYGAHKSAKRAKNLKEVFKLLDRRDVFDFTLEASEVAGEITAILENEGKMLDFRESWSLLFLLSFRFQGFSFISFRCPSPLFHSRFNLGARVKKRSNHCNCLRFGESERTLRVRLIGLEI